jgi:hypothetical protein
MRTCPRYRHLTIYMTPLSQVLQTAVSAVTQVGADLAFYETLVGRSRLMEKFLNNAIKTCAIYFSLSLELRIDYNLTISEFKRLFVC